ncbi:TraE/TraK family type IV conjugative transfer system protein [Haemophilus pittmaniae]|uniref:TraE/TraK family type IV conjugative transfer system protein n=1 Tax=Haemophilus pittmaniae TaxID=249188 RepID=UPI0028DC2AC3|nr:TraE/TraK family type IV conjugative transfer system protein [Haemophilus pittmaniae]
MNFNRIKELNRSLGIAVLIMTVIAASTSLLAHRLYSTNKELVQNAIENRQIIVTPMINNTNQEYGFKGERGGSDYLRLMALSFISLRLDVNSQTVENSHEILLSYASNELREKLIPILSQEKRSLSVDNGSSVFYPKAIKVSPSNGIVDVKGELVFSYGIRKTPSVNKHYQLRIDMEKGLLKLTGFSEILDEK